MPEAQRQRPQLTLFGGPTKPAPLATGPAAAALPLAASRTSSPRSAAPAAGGHGPWQVTGKPGEHLVLMPGQMHFGTQVASLRTLLGSCVAITLWHPGKRIGGMCHYLLPSRARKPGDALDGRYGDETLEAMIAALKLTRTAPEEYHCHLYGGADTLPEGTTLKFNVGERNIEQGWSLVDKYGFQLQGIDVGEDIPRTVTLTLADGAVDMRRGTGRAPANAAAATAGAARR
ncbi:MAG: chemotaxis protein CheD [Aquabacterium sp.]